MNILARARDLLQGIIPAAPAKVHSFSVVCPEGHRLRGERTEAYQALRCPKCGERIFVLPRSPLPELSGPAPARPSRRTLPGEGSTSGPEEEPVARIDPLPPRQTGDGEVEGKIEWIDPEHASVGPGGAAHERDVAPVEETAAPAQPGGRAGRQSEVGPRRPRPARRPRLRPRGAPPVAVPVEPVESLRVRLGAWTWHRRHQLLFLAVVCVVLATVGYRLRWWRRQELPRIAEIGKTQGLAALDAGKFDLADQLLSEAERAVNALGDASEGSAEIRKGAAEAAIFVNQVPDRLETILDLADKPDPKSWSSRFDTVYKGRAILIQASVTRVPHASGAGQYDLDYRVFPDGEGPRPRRVGRIDLRGFRLFESSRPKLGEKLLLGATLDSLRFDKDNEEWLFGLEPDSGVRITHTKALEALEWPSEDELPAEEQPCQYESLLGDQATATELLRAAWTIDPQSKAVADAFRRRGFRKVNEEWVEPPRSRNAAAAAPDEPSVSALLADVTLRNKSPGEVRARLGGKPNRVVWSASQGQLIEQWIDLGPTLNQYVNFLHPPGVPVPRVVAAYTHPRAASESLSAP